MCINKTENTSSLPGKFGKQGTIFNADVQFNVMNHFLRHHNIKCLDTRL